MSSKACHDCISCGKKNIPTHRMYSISPPVCNHCMKTGKMKVKMNLDPVNLSNDDRMIRIAEIYNIEKKYVKKHLKIGKKNTGKTMLECLDVLEEKLQKENKL